MYLWPYHNILQYSIHVPVFDASIRMLLSNLVAVEVITPGPHGELHPRRFVPLWGLSAQKSWVHDRYLSAEIISASSPSINSSRPPDPPLEPP